VGAWTVTAWSMGGWSVTDWTMGAATAPAHADSDKNKLVVKTAVTRRMNTSQNENGGR